MVIALICGSASRWCETRGPLFLETPETFTKALEARNFAVVLLFIALMPA